MYEASSIKSMKTYASRRGWSSAKAVRDWTSIAIQLVAFNVLKSSIMLSWSKSYNIYELGFSWITKPMHSDHVECHLLLYLMNGTRPMLTVLEWKDSFYKCLDMDLFSSIHCRIYCSGQGDHSKRHYSQSNSRALVHLNYTIDIYAKYLEAR